MKFIQNKTYYEDYAKDILIRIGVFKESELIKHERPDWISVERNIGIEVVRAVFKNEEEATKFFIKIKEKEKRLPTRQELERFSQLGGSIQGKDISEMQASFCPTFNGYDELTKTIKHKIEILNQKNFCRFEINELYVFVECYVLKEKDINNIMTYVEMQSEKYKYDIIYLDGNHEIWICDIRAQKYEKKQKNNK